MAPPAPRDGEEEVARDDFGVLAVLLMLGERLGFEDAWRAADGWGGGVSVSFRRDETNCVRLAVAGDTAEDLDELRDAFDRWAATMPDAESERGDGVALLTSCDPGAGFEPPASPDDERTFVVLSLRAGLIGGFREAGVPDQTRSRCLVDQMISRLGSNEFARIVQADELTPADSQALGNAVARGAAQCDVELP